MTPTAPTTVGPVSATKPYVLEDAGAGNMEIAIALTPRDEDNLVICELCKKKFRVPKTLSLLRLCSSMYSALYFCC